MSQSTHDKLRYAQELLSHQIPSRDVAEILDRALDALIERLERRKCARASRPLPGGRPARHIPAYVKRAVWEHDRGQCTFVSKAGRRCTARTLLEFDHVDEVAQRRRAAEALARAEQAQERVRAALSYVRPRSCSHPRSANGPGTAACIRPGGSHEPQRRAE